VIQVINGLMAVEESAFHEVRLTRRTCFVDASCQVVVSVPERFLLALENVIIAPAHVRHVPFAFEHINARRSHNQHNSTTKAHAALLES
jgi:hypothetical protein